MKHPSGHLQSNWELFPGSGCPEEDKRRKNVVEGGVEEYERRDDSDSDVTLT